ncbi:CPXCG motif-containing cysteine-rich protein [Luteimonas chenhongjianii]|uniref:CPXCG motif-containing cysteine-rich protein n=1 Tax=Luteimonas chenhongjianii TaxID=2006110 RepID=A0A290XFG9_9GAMM|nr:CPXCG motif-containing cysteine-rich protein [Luteimonas chenhongjianii]ATD67813.1 CPXCG motif-containing cysteine-rich protein [Luteimonas chenhongjianii]
MDAIAHMRCPWCGERFETLVDASADAADYIEDCPVCCRPIEMQLRVGTEDDYRLQGGRGD